MPGTFSESFCGVFVWIHQVKEGFDLSGVSFAAPLNLPLSGCLEAAHCLNFPSASPAASIQLSHKGAEQVLFCSHKINSVS